MEGARQSGESRWGAHAPRVRIEKHALAVLSVDRRVASFFFFLAGCGDDEGIIRARGGRARQGRAGQVWVYGSDTPDPLGCALCLAPR